MYHVSAQSVDERMINVHYSYYKMLDHRTTAPDREQRWDCLSLEISLELVTRSDPGIVW